MAYIKIDRTRLESAAQAIDTYLERHRRNMGKINEEILLLGNEWRGEDYTQVKKEWNQLDDKGSTADKMNTSLSAYASALRHSAKLYKEAQIRAINRADTLCK